MLDVGGWEGGGLVRGMWVGEEVVDVGCRWMGGRWVGERDVGG